MMRLSLPARERLKRLEGFRAKAYIPVPGDRATIGYGFTGGVKLGDRMTREEADARLRFEDVTKMLGLEPQPTAGRQAGGLRRGNAPCRRYGLNGLRHGRRSASGLGAQAFFSLNSASWPWPVGELGEAVFSQLPFGTRDQALPW